MKKITWYGFLNFWADFCFETSRRDGKDDDDDNKDNNKGQQQNNDGIYTKNTTISHQIKKQSTNCGGKLSSNGEDKRKTKYMIFEKIITGKRHNKKPQDGDWWRDITEGGGNLLSHQTQQLTK